MKNLGILTTLSLYPQVDSTYNNVRTIIRGASAILDVNLGTYDVAGLTSIEFVLKWANGLYRHIKTNLINGKPDDTHFFINSNNILEYALSPEETAKLPLADMTDPILFEVAITSNWVDLNNNKQQDQTETLTVTDRPYVILVIDSLLNEYNILKEELENVK